LRLDAGSSATGQINPCMVATAHVIRASQRPNPRLLAGGARTHTPALCRELTRRKSADVANWRNTLRYCALRATSCLEAACASVSVLSE
jgi:hypothetical protein